jgi:uncharacterized RDD family membrane protein YckC
MALMWLPFGLTPKPKNTGGVHYADIYARALAAAVDMFLIFFLLSNLFQLIRKKLYEGADLTIFNALPTPANFLELLDVLFLALKIFLSSPLFSVWALEMSIQFLFIAVVMISVQCIWHTTPGKRLLGIKIVRAETLEPVARWRYIVRFLAYIPATLPLMLGIFWASFNKQRRGWHDYIAGTVVIHTKPEGWYWEQVKRLWRTYVLKKDVSSD